MRTKVLLIALVAALSCLMSGCYNYLEQKQKSWHRKIDLGSAAVHRLTRPGTPSLVVEQLLALIGEPDLKIGVLRFPDLLAKDDPFRERTMSDIWTGYCQSKRDVGELDCVEGPGKWRDCEDFKKSTLWIYEESKHFKKPLYSNDLLHCLFCGKSYFVTFLFFAEEERIVSSRVVVHEKPLRMNDE